tara:strand:+ start:290 stop:1108 length:819 start_codon:yes stop_codon:yes gene_type:complete
MRLKHNKKRNTAFLFEVIAREYVKAIIRKNVNKQNIIKRIIQENFSKTCTLAGELSLYRELLETKNLSRDDATMLLREAKERYSKLNKKDVFLAQSKLIKEVNYKLSQSVFNNFVPNFKDLATIYNIFNNKTSVKEKILLEKRLVEDLLVSENSDNNKHHVDNLTYKTFVKKFNKKYSVLPKDQKDLLTNYIASFADNSVALKTHLNEQITELKNKFKKYESDESLQTDQMKEKFEGVRDKLEEYKSMPITDIMIVEVLRMQDLARELENVG